MTRNFFVPSRGTRRALRVRNLWAVRPFLAMFRGVRTRMASAARLGICVSRITRSIFRTLVCAILCTCAISSSPTRGLGGSAVATIGVWIALTTLLKSARRRRPSERAAAPAASPAPISASTRPAVGSPSGVQGELSLSLRQPTYISGFYRAGRPGVSRRPGWTTCAKRP